MGYYNGSGVVTGGGETINPFNSINYKNSNDQLCYQFVEQKTKTTNTSSHGVSLATAQARGASMNMSDKLLYYIWWNTGGGSGEMIWVLPDCKGTKEDVSYSQIADSNLYELNVTETVQHVRVKVNNGGWGGWEG